MTLTVARLDSMPDAEAAFKLAACCGAPAWVAGMLKRRPFGTRENLLAASEVAASALLQADWLDAFSHHPQIGQRNATAVVSATAESWSANEQSAVSTASEDVRAALAEGNTEYENRFGFIFIISASGRSADDILAALRERLSNQMDGEIKVAAAEQRKITRLRLEQLVPA